jgi:hypothetical protein
MKRKLLLMLALMLSPALLMIAKAEAYNSNYQINAVFGSTPVIDGSIGASEWADASMVTFNNTVAYLKQDGKSLYVALSVVDTTVNASDGIGLCIDKNNDGGNVKADDFAVGIFRNGTRMELQGNSTTGPEWATVLPSGWEAAMTSNATGWQAEFNISYSKIGVTAGQAITVGVAPDSYDAQVNLNYYWPSYISGSEILDATNWGNLYSSQQWIPEFTSIFIPPLFMFATLLVAIAYRRKHST